jgi:hypothetical protein
MLVLDNLGLVSSRIYSAISKPKAVSHNSAKFIQNKSSSFVRSLPNFSLINPIPFKFSVSSELSDKHEVFGDLLLHFSRDFFRLLPGRQLGRRFKPPGK